MKNKLNFKLIVGTGVIFIIVGVLSVIILGKIAPQKQSSSDKVTKTIVILKPADVIKQYQKQGEIKDLTTLYQKKDAPITGLNTISYIVSKSYATHVTATDFVQFEQKDKTAQKNHTSIKASTESFLVKSGLDKKPNPQTGDNPTYTVFDSDQTTCQLIDLPPMIKNGALLGLACVKKSVINDQYATINKLLALFSGNKADIASPEFIRLNTIKEANKTLSTTDVYGIGLKKTAISLFFAAIDDKWEYIGQLPLSTGTTETNQTAISRNISGELKTAINNQKYGDFLKKNVK